MNKRRAAWRGRRAGMLVALAAASVGAGARAETEGKERAGPEAKPAKLRLSGFGWWGNLERRNALELLLDEGGTRAEFDGGFIEDAALVLNSELVEEGFFAAEIEAVWRDAEGREGRARLDARLSEGLPRGVRATELRLTARPGVRAVVEKVEIAGLTALAEEEARAYFRPDAGLFTPDVVRAWSEGRARRGAAELAEALRSQGYAEATVKVAERRLDEASGRVELSVQVEEGPVWRVAEAKVEVAGGGEDEAGGLAGENPGTEAVTRLEGAVWTRARSLDAGQAPRRQYQERGYPDAAVAWTVERGEVAADGRARPVTVTARVERGGRRRVGEVGFAGVEKTRPGLLEQRTRGLRPGDWFDPAEVEAARMRLARLGVFRRVEVRETDREDGTRAVVFAVREAPPWEAAWLLGWGSYEQVRVGVEVTRGNLWGLAHRTRFEAVQSLKGTRADYRYTVPTFWEDTVEAAGRVFGLRREEQSFDRVEYGAAVELQREVPWIEVLATAGFTYEVLRADDVKLGAARGGVDDATVASFDVALTRDRRDNPIRPQAGTRWAVHSQTALPELGSEVRYERLELAWAWHRALGEERWMHVGVSQGWVFAGENDAPVNKLFFPGGESSLRGYQQGEATQRDANGRFVGVRSAWLVNWEVEQLVTGRWTAVVFLDVLGTAVDADDWPGDETLASAGLGVRYQSPIGPLRLEYGGNLNRRDGDPAGTLHFSIGFPF